MSKQNATLLQYASLALAVIVLFNGIFSEKVSQDEFNKHEQSNIQKFNRVDDKIDDLEKIVHNIDKNISNINGMLKALSKGEK